MAHHRWQEVLTQVWRLNQPELSQAHRLPAWPTNEDIDQPLASPRAASSARTLCAFWWLRAAVQPGELGRQKVPEGGLEETPETR